MVIYFKVLELSIHLCGGKGECETKFAFLLSKMKPFH